MKLTTHLHLAAIFSMCGALFRSQHAPVYLHNIALKKKRQLQLTPACGIAWCSNNSILLTLSLFFIEDKTDQKKKDVHVTCKNLITVII
jgi:hypothetical protein